MGDARGSGLLHATASIADVGDPRIGAVFGRYRILHELGPGQAGVVYEGVDQVLERSVALKFLTQEILAQPDSVDRIIRETQCLARLSHPHLVTIHDIRRDEQDFCLVMELLNPESLGQILSYGGPFSWAEATRIIADCCGALQAAHAAGITHGGIKPTNLLYSLSGVVKLVDFGLLRWKKDDPKWSASDAPLQVPRYLSPEQAAGWEGDARSDLYSIGATYYALLTGEPPFSGETVDEILRGHLTSPLPDPRTLVPDIAGACVHVLRKALEKEPGLRYQDAGELLTDLQQLLQKEPSPSPGAPRQHEDAKQSRRRFLLAAAGGALGLMAGEYCLLRGASQRGLVDRPKLAEPKSSPSSAPKPDLPPIKVGVLHSLSGPLAVSEHPLADASLLAIEELNARGGVLGRRLQPVVCDGASEVHPESADTHAALKLLEQEKVAVVFGGYGSSLRKSVLPDFDKYDRLLFYPAPYEGIEESQHVIYTGATPNQLCIPAAKWFLEALGAKRFFLIGTDTLMTHVVSEMVRDWVVRIGGEIVGVHHALAGETELSAVVRHFEESHPQAILNMLVGDSNAAFFRALLDADIMSHTLPVLSFMLGENELAQLGDLDLHGHYVARSRFPALDPPSADTFTSHFQTKFGLHRPVSEVMESAYYGVHLWAAAVKKAGTTETAPVRQALRQQEYVLGSVRVSVEPSTLHTWKVLQIGKIRTDHSIEIVHTADALLPPVPFPPPRSRAEWSAFGTALFQKWGERWENPRRAADSRVQIMKAPAKTPRRK